MSLFRKVLRSRTLPVAGLLVLALSLQAEPVQSQNTTDSSSGQAGNMELKDNYTGLFPEVVARVNGEPIYGKQLEREIRNELIQIGSPKWTDLREDYRGQLKYNAITSLVNAKLLYEEAVSSGIEVTDAEVQDEYLSMSRNFESEEEFKALLKSRHLDQQTLIAELHKNLVVRKFADVAIRNRISVTPEEMSKYYQENIDEFKHPEIVRTSQIFIRSGNTPEKDAEARQLAESLLKRIQNGEDFAKLAGEYSMSSTASQGGDVGYSDRNSLAAEYADVAFSIPVGDVRLIEMQQGYRIMKVTDRKKEGTATLEEAKESLVDFLKEEKTQTEVLKLIYSLRDKSEIELLIPAGIPLTP